ncbi:hypothetical protein H9L10_15295 [Phycicoccus endophyticus]|uniref:Uncharacterized protein n=1 Tax=Phycicoccus endophyticus TaxID=1690220 RepID=A0A7G9R1P3_9MICO|nr:hypothetical protein [Phycicoccus endophyticus]NHI18691.1 hypothetical protein [Phycicoccus endophyticus]QNN49518.1 hypothetical protein H9L10_15295 [Phycicoccus endophyticus]GGL37203.1 hypothetical protein GCM10012283_19740 [Phycicoccus endophyticus]
MTTDQLLLLLLVVVVAVLLVWLLVRRSSARRDEARAQAEGLRAEAEGLAPAVAGQEAFAEQAEERADVARAEADRLAAEAAEHRESAESTRTDYDAMLARADAVDPDVRASADLTEERRPQTRAEARRLREEAERSSWAGRPAVPLPGAASAVAAGAGAAEGLARREEPSAEPSDVLTEDPSARIAAAADYRDDPGEDAVADPGEQAAPDPDEVWSAAEAGTEPASGDEAERVSSAATDAQEPTGEWGGPREPAEESEQVEDMSEHHAEEDRTPAEQAEQVPAEQADPPEGPEVAEDPGSAAFAEPEPPGDEEPAPQEEPERDWAADEGEILADTSDRADRLAQEREDMQREALDAGMDTGSLPEPPPADEPTSTGDEPTADEPTATGDEPEEDPTEDEAPSPDDDEAPAAAGRRVSDFREIRDGGYGVGSAAPIEDGAQPMDHPVQAYRDTMTFRLPEDPGYDSTEPDVWFYDAGAAERSGFHRSEG